jgi:hypothetical protein
MVLVLGGFHMAQKMEGSFWFHLTKINIVLKPCILFMTSMPKQFQGCLFLKSWFSFLVIFFICSKWRKEYTLARDIRGEGLLNVIRDSLVFCTELSNVNEFRGGKMKENENSHKWKNLDHFFTKR